MTPDTLRSLAVDYGTPLYVYDGDHLRRRLEQLKASFQDTGVRHYYFEAANRAPALLEIFRDLDRKAG